MHSLCLAGVNITNVLKVSTEPAAYRQKRVQKARQILTVSTPLL